MRNYLVGALAVLAISATAATAQTQAPQNPGPVIPGVCVFHNARLLAQSTAGQSLQSGMQALTQQVRTELQPYSDSITSELQAIQSAGQTIPQAEQQQRVQALQQRVNELQELEQTRQVELAYTQQQQMLAIATAVDPIIVQVYQERGCGLLVDRESVYLLNPAMDITEVVVQRLNQALPSLSFGRMTPPAQPAQ